MRNVIFYCVAGDESGEQYGVTIDLEDESLAVMDLVHAIHSSNPLFSGQQQVNLSLWKVCISATDDICERIHNFPFDKSSQMVKALPLKQYFPTAPGLGIISVIVKPNIVQKFGASTTSLNDVDCISNLASKRSRKEVPALRELLGFLDRPLDESEKLPLSSSAFRSLVSHSNRCTEEDVGILFKQVDPPPFSTQILKLFTIVYEQPPPMQGTETSFIPFITENVGKVISLLIPDGHSIRNSNFRTETRQLRPDFGFLVSDTCVFRGEEKAPHDFGANPKAELADKLHWKYSPAPYVLGYYCFGPALTLAAICPPTTPDGPSVVYDLQKTDLSTTPGRIRNVLRLINLSSLLHPLADLASCGAGEFIAMERENSVVEKTNTVVLKRYTSKDANERIRRLRKAYDVLHSLDAPNTDRLLYVDIAGNVVHLGPIGIDHQPKSEEELRDCLGCILELLKIIHPKRFYHRDLRWPNIIRSAKDPKKWIVIDWEDSSGEPTPAEPRFGSSNHSPDIKCPGHGAEVDIWGVGHLISSASANISLDLRALGVRICDKAKEISATDVLEMIEGCR